MPLPTDDQLMEHGLGNLTHRDGHPFRFTAVSGQLPRLNS